MTTQEIQVIRSPPLSLGRYAVVSFMLGILTVTVLLPFGLALVSAGWAALLAQSEGQPTLRPDEMALVGMALFVASSLVAGVAVASWVGTHPAAGSLGTAPESAPPAPVRRPWWAFGALALAFMLIAAGAGRQVIGPFLEGVSVLTFFLWLGASAMWGAVRLVRWVAGVGWRLGTRSTTGTVALAGMALGAICLWIGIGISAAAATPELRRQLERSRVPASFTASAGGGDFRAGDDGTGAFALAAHSAPVSDRAQSECLEQLTPALREQARSEARRRGVRWEDTEDLVHDAALAVCARFPYEFAAYFMRSVQNAATDWWRREYRNCPLPEVEQPDCLPDPEAAAVSAQEAEVVRHQRCGLSRDDQEILRLRVDEWLDYDEIASRLLITPAAARKRVSRATGLLKLRVFQACELPR